MKFYLAKALSFCFIASFTFLTINDVNGENSQGESQVIAKATVILDLESTPINGGFNPEFKGRRITGKVLLGNNKCLSKGISVKFKTMTDKEHDYAAPGDVASGNQVHLKAFLLINKKEKPNFCTQEYMPVYENFSIDVTAKKIVIHNVDRMNNNVEIK